MKKQVFHLPQDSISDIIGCVNEKNEQILTKEEILRKEQLLEETYLRLAKGMNNPALSATVTVTKRFGDVNLEISARGEAANPLISLSEWIEDESDLFSANLLKSNRHLLGYSRRNGENIVSIKILEGSGQQMVRMIVAMILGVGFIMMSSVFGAAGLPAGAVTFFLCVDPVVDMFCTVANVACNVCSSLLLARKEGMLDEGVYRGK